MTAIVLGINFMVYFPDTPATACMVFNRIRKITSGWTKQKK